MIKLLNYVINKYTFFFIAKLYFTNFYLFNKIYNKNLIQIHRSMSGNMKPSEVKNFKLKILAWLLYDICDFIS